MNTTALLSIGTRIKTLCPNIQHIDLYNNQYLPDAELQTNPFSKPAVFIEFGPTQWDDTNDGIQQGEGLLRVHVVIEVYADTYSLFTLTPEEQQTLLEHYQVAQQVHAALQD
ncbi:MAG TPA: hypothetical protein VK154_14890, partial [Chitinophagales bacterium]|nr:hypothetical protein [Chitinophagales bacterium]